MLDNYISESVSEGVSVGDIYVEQALAQLNVAYSLVASYAKDVAYVEYMAEMNGVDIYQEGFFEEMEIDENMSDDSFDGQDKSLNWNGKLRKFGKTMLSGPGKVWSLIKAAASAVATAATNLWRFITEKSLNKCIKKLEADESGKKYSVPSRLIRNVANFVTDFGVFATAVTSYIESVESKTSAKWTDFKFPEISDYDNSSDTRELTATELAKVLKSFTRADFKSHIKDSIKKLREAIDECDKEMKSEDKKNFKAVTKKFNPVEDDFKKFKDIASNLTKINTDILHDLRTVSNKVLKTMKSDSKSKGSSDDTSDDEE